MLEIFLLVYLCKKIRATLEAKGRSAGWFQFLLVVLWFGGEFGGAVVGIMLDGSGGAAYFCALIGAVVGACAGVAIANGAAPAPSSALHRGFEVLPPSTQPPEPYLPPDQR